MKMVNCVQLKTWNLDNCSGFALIQHYNRRPKWIKFISSNNCVLCNSIDDLELGLEITRIICVHLPPPNSSRNHEMRMMNAMLLVYMLATSSFMVAVLHQYRTLVIVVHH